MLVWSCSRSSRGSLTLVHGAAARRAAPVLRLLHPLLDPPLRVPRRSSRTLSRLHGRAGELPGRRTAARPAERQPRWQVLFRLLLAIPALSSSRRRRRRRDRFAAALVERRQRRLVSGGLVLNVGVLGWFASLVTGRMPRGPARCRRLRGRLPRPGAGLPPAPDRPVSERRPAPRCSTAGAAAASIRSTSSATPTTSAARA